MWAVLEFIYRFRVKQPASFFGTQTDRCFWLRCGELKCASLCKGRISGSESRRSRSNRQASVCTLFTPVLKATRPVAGATGGNCSLYLCRKSMLDSKGPTVRQVAVPELSIVEHVRNSTRTGGVKYFWGQSKVPELLRADFVRRSLQKVIRHSPEKWQNRSMVGQSRTTHNPGLLQSAINTSIIIDTLSLTYFVESKYG